MYIDGKTKTVLLRARDPLYLRSLLPVSRLVDHDKYNIAVKHTIGSTKVLRNLGFKVPAPIMTQYRWPGKYTPFDHQYTMSEFLTLHKRAFNLSEMGVGKSASAIWAADHLIEAGEVRKVLILSPLSTLERVWKQDLFDLAMHRTVGVVYGSRKKRLEVLGYDLDFYVMNHEGIKIKDVFEVLRKRKDIDLIIVDEASVFRNAGTDLFKALRKVILGHQRLWLLTGTPCPNEPTDAWALARLVAPNRVPQFFGQFRRNTMIQVATHKWVPRPEAYKVAYDAMQPAIRFKKADCLTLPPVVTVERQAQLSKEQVKHFKDMMQTTLMQHGTEKITAVNAADKVNKLRQILCGVIKHPEFDNRYIEIDHGPRTELLIDTLHEAAAKVIVVVPFKGIIKTLEKKISKHFSVAVLNGDVSVRKRNEIIVNFKTTPDPHVLLCHPKVMSHGLNLTEADMLIFYAPIYSNDQFQQVLERFNRAGQTRTMTVVRMAAHPIEWKIYQSISAAQDVQSSILDLYSSIITEGEYQHAA